MAEFARVLHANEGQKQNRQWPDYPSNQRPPVICWPGPSAEMCRGFLLDKFWRILPGIFLGTFFHKNEKIRRQNPRKNPADPKSKCAQNPFCQRPTLIFGSFFRLSSRYTLRRPCAKEVSTGKDLKGMRCKRLKLLNQPQTTKSMHNCALQQTLQLFIKKPHVRNLSARSSGTGIGCAIFVLFLLENPHAHEIPRFREES